MYIFHVFIDAVTHKNPVKPKQFWNKKLFKTKDTKFLWCLVEFYTIKIDISRHRFLLNSTAMFVYLSKNL